MTERQATANWEGDLMSGMGDVSTGTGVLANQPLTWASRTEDPEGRTSPEELIAAAHAGCYAMALSNTLATDGHPPKSLSVTAKVGFGPKPGGGMKVTYSRLSVRGKVPGLDQAGFEEEAKKGEQGCPVSNALRNNVEISLEASLEQ
ncbi:MAG: OsmC family peroxiredoxin [Thermomicrobiales bacterium]